MSGATCSSGYTSPETITVDVHNLVYLVNNLGRVQRQQLLFLRILVLVNSLASVVFIILILLLLLTPSLTSGYLEGDDGR